MTKNQIKTLVKNVIAALVIVLATLGINSYVGVLDFLSNNVSEVIDALFIVVNFIIGLVSTYKLSKNSTVGEIIEEKYETRVRTLNTSDDAGIYSYAKAL